MWGYSFVIYAITLCFGLEQMTIKGVVSAICPVLTKKYWFVNVYLGLYMISPFLNKLLKELTKCQMKTLLVTLLVLFSIKNTILPSTWCLDSSGGYGIIWFTTLYIIAGIIRLYNFRKKSAFCLCIYFGNVLIIYFGNYVLENTIGVMYAQKFYGYNSIFVLIAAVALFMYMLNVDIKNSRIIKSVNVIAKSAFSVYIIHYSINDILWTKLLKLRGETLNSVYGVLQVVIAIILVYFICTIIDFIRRIVIDYLLKKIEKTNLYIKTNAIIEIKQNEFYKFD